MLLQKYVIMASSVSRKRETESCTVIGYSSGKDGALVPTGTYWLCSRREWRSFTWSLLTKHEFKMTR